MILLKNGSVYNYEKDAIENKDILIDGEKIIDINDSIIKENCEIIELDGKLVFPGLIDTHTHLREPGYAHKETIATGTMSALKGGYTAVFPMANIVPTIDTVENFNYVNELIEKNKNTDVYPMGALSKGTMGIELADIENLADKVKCFSDDGKYLEDETLKEQAMSMIAKCDSLYVSHAEVAEYIVSDNRRSEYEAVQRDLVTAEKTDCRYHVCHVSTKETIDYIREAKKNGVKVTCEVGPHHLTLCDEDIQGNPNFKMNPPLRPRSDVDYVIQALLDGVIDNIATDHAPHTEEEKSGEYNKTPNGIIGLETAFPLIYTTFVKGGRATLKQMNEWFNLNPAKIFRISPNEVKIGSTCNLAVFDIDNEHTYTKEEILSKSKNSPYIGRTLYGFAVLTIKSGKISYRERI